MIISCSETKEHENNSILKESHREQLASIDTSYKELTILHLSGTSYEVGFQHGNLLKSEIIESVETWKNELKKEYKLEPNEFIQLFIDSTDYITAIKKWTPDLLEELKGISDGSEIELKTILVYNFIDEIWSNFPLINPRDHCTALAVNNIDKKDSAIFLGGNIDYFQEHCYLLDIEKTGMKRILTPTLPGYLGANGQNHKFGITVNTLMDLNGSFDGLPVACVVRGALMQDNFESAVTFLNEIKHGSGQNYTLANNNKILSLECSANSKNIYWPNPEDKKYTYHTNHSKTNKDFTDRVIKWVTEELNQDVYTWEYHCDRLQSLHERISSNSNLEDIKSALSSKDYKEPICKKETWYSTIMEFRKNETRLLIAPGRPDSTDYITINIK